MQKETEKKVRDFFENNRDVYDSYEGDFDEFFFEVKKKWRLKYKDDFYYFDKFVDYLTEDDEEDIYASAGKVQTYSIKPSVEGRIKPALDGGHVLRLTKSSILPRKKLSEPLPEVKDTDQPQKIESLKDEIDGLFKRWIKQEKNGVKYIDEDSEVGKEELYRLESKAITKFYNELVSYKTNLEAAYRDQLWKSNLWYPRKWMIDNQIIYWLIKKYKICEVLNELEKRNVKSNKSTPFRYLFPLNDTKYKGRHPQACFITNADFYNSILPELKIKKITLQKYFMALCKIGAIKKLDKAGRADVKKNETLYSLGYLTDYNGSLNKLNRFLKQKNKKEFAKFSM